MLAGNAGDALTLLDEAAVLVPSDDSVRLAWVSAYAYAAHTRRFELLPGGTGGLGEELQLHRSRPRARVTNLLGAEAAAWVFMEYSWALKLRFFAMQARDPLVVKSAEQWLSEPPPASAPSIAVRVKVIQADALRLRGLRVEALEALKAARRGTQVAQLGGSGCERSGTRGKRRTGEEDDG
jgi:hypothetical protein